MIKVSYEEVFSKLSLSTWKTNLVILEEIARSKGILNNEIDFSSVCSNIYRLKRKGYAISRECSNDQERVAIRGGRPYFEYLLTQDGQRIRDESSLNGLELVLLPT